MAAKDLMKKYGGVWSEHPDFPSEDWRYQVQSGDTRLGYWDWVAENLLVDIPEFRKAEAS
jgi:hypothetical protein